MTDLNVAYTEMKFWLPMITVAAIVWKAKTSVTGWVDKLFSNHLAHIEAATVNTAKETIQTNCLLRDSVGKLDMVQNTVNDQHEKNLQVWAGVCESLTILKERSTRSTPKKRNASRQRGIVHEQSHK